MPVNRQTIARASYRLGGASEYTQLVRWDSESTFTPIHVPGVFSLRTVAKLMFSMLHPTPPSACTPATFYSGGAPDTSDFPEIYDGDGMSPVDVTLMDGGLPDSNFC